jgi:hypothetical protein
MNILHVGLSMTGTPERSVLKNWPLLCFHLSTQVHVCFVTTHLKKKQRGRVISRHSRLFWWIWILCHLALGLRTASMIFERTWKQKLASPAAGHFYLWQIKGQKSFCSPLRIMLLSNLLHCHLYMTYMSTQEFQCIQMCVSSIYRHIYVCK